MHNKIYIWNQKKQLKFSMYVYGKHVNSMGKCENTNYASQIFDWGVTMFVFECSF